MNMENTYTVTLGESDIEYILDMLQQQAVQHLADKTLTCKERDQIGAYIHGLQTRLEMATDFEPCRICGNVDSVTELRLVDDGYICEECFYSSAYASRDDAYQVRHPIT